MNEATEWTRLLLTKQQQQAEAERADQALRQSQLNQVFDSAGRLASAMRQYRLDSIANKLVNDEPVPRAVAVDAQGRPDAAVNQAARAHFKHPVRRGDIDPFYGGVAGLEQLEKYRTAPHRQLREQTGQPRTLSTAVPGYTSPIGAQAPFANPSAGSYAAPRGQSLHPLIQGADAALVMPSWPRPNETAIRLLRDAPSLAGEFDRKFGQGMAARYLSQQ